MMARWRQRCTFFSLPLLLLVILITLLPPASQEEPPSDGGGLSSSDGVTPILEDTPYGDGEPTDVENDPSLSEERPSVENDSTCERELPFVKDFSSEIEGKTLSVADKSSTSEEELSTVEDDLSPGEGQLLSSEDDPLPEERHTRSVEDDPSPGHGQTPSIESSLFSGKGRARGVGDDLSSSKGEPGSVRDDPTEDALLVVFSSSRNQSSPTGRSSRKEISDEEQEDDIVSTTSAVTAVQLVTPDASSLRQESLHDGSAAAGPRRLELNSAQKTFQLCKSIYRSTYGTKLTNVEDVGFVYLYNRRNTALVIVMKNFVDVCRPLFRVFEKCVDFKFITFCPAAKVVFLHSHGCVRQSYQEKYFEKVLAFYLMEDNTECFEGICNGSFKLIESSIGGLTYQIFNIVSLSDNKICNNGLGGPSSLIKRRNHTVYMTHNTQWPCCYAMYLVVWQGHPEEHGLNGGWSYLPALCRVGEVLLMVMVAGVAVSGVIGNLVVVVVMMGGEHRGQESSMLRTSLAFSDLLTGLFVVVPSFCYHLAPFFRPPEYETLTGSQSISVSHTVIERDTSTTFFSNTLRYEGGFPMFQVLVYGTCSLVSLLTLFLLSIERLVMTGRALRYSHYITRGGMKVIIVSTWVLGLLETILLYYDYVGKVNSVAWSSFAKVPKRNPGGNPFGLAYSFFSNIHVVLYMIAGIATVAFSMLAVRNFVREESRVATEWKSYGMRTTVHYYQENRRILTTMVLMIVFYLISVVPTTILLIINLMGYMFVGIHLFGYLTVWLFLASTAWNPWVYNMRSRQFTGDLADMLYKVLPTPFRERLRPYLSISHHKTWDNTELTPGRKNMLTKLGLAET